MLSWGSVDWGIVQLGMCQSGKCWLGKCPIGEVSGQQFIRSKHVRDQKFVLKFVTYLQIVFVFKQNIYSSCLQMETGSGAKDVGGGVKKFVIFCGCHKCMTLKWFKITANSIAAGSSFFFNIKSQARYILTAQIATPYPSPLH